MLKLCSNWIIQDVLKDIAEIPKSRDFTPELSELDLSVMEWKRLSVLKENINTDILLKINMVTYFPLSDASPRQGDIV
jgi:hypothetical protein